MNIAVRIEPPASDPAEVDYRWDPDTDILTASLRGPVAGEGMSGSLGVEGSDGSWIMFDVAKGRIAGVEVAVWPEVRKRAEAARTLARAAQAPVAAEQTQRWVLERDFTSAI